MTAAMLALQAEELRPRVRVFGQTLSRQIGKKEQPFRTGRHRRRFLQKLRVGNLVIGKRQPRPADGIAAGVENRKSAPGRVSQMKVIDQRVA